MEVVKNMEIAKRMKSFMMTSFNFIMLIYLQPSIQNIMPQCDMSMGGMVHFRREISCNVGIIPALNSQDSLTKRKPATLEIKNPREPRL